MYGLSVMGGMVDERDAWSMLPSNRIVRLDSADTLLASLDPLPEHAPAILACHVASGESVTDVVGAVLDELETAALGLFPAWLPGAENMNGRSALEMHAVRVLARTLASTSRHFGPFVTDLAAAALTGTRLDPGRFAQQTRAVGLTRVLADSYGRENVALLVTGDADIHRQQVLVTACEWLADHGRTAVWISGDAIPGIDRFPTVTLPRPATPGRSPQAPAGRTRVRFPALAGRPHPGSAAELKLEKALAACEWAHGRRWNMPYRTSVLQPWIRVDLIWPDALCIVEVDGDDHRLREKYAADRTRDVRLQIDGFGVLRFTNEQVLDDVTSVLVAIEQYLSGRRRDPGTVPAATAKGSAQ